MIAAAGKTSAMSPDFPEESMCFHPLRKSPIFGHPDLSENSFTH
jgi:hypothetical protein